MNFECIYGPSQGPRSRPLQEGRMWKGRRGGAPTIGGRQFADRSRPHRSPREYRHKVAGFALGSALGGLAGALYAFNFQYLQPQTFVYELTVILLLGVVLGGAKSLWGAFVCASLVVLLPNLLSHR